MPKAGGRRSLSIEQRKRFALRLYSVIRRRCGSFEKFKKLLSRRKSRVREVTVRGWLPPLELLNQDSDAGSKVRQRDWESVRTADLPGLLEVADVLDVSIDHLMGYPVSERRSDREPTGDLARALVEHVVAQYLSRVAHQRRDGLAEAVNGRLRLKSRFGDESDSDGLEIDVGNARPRQAQLLVVDNPQHFLELVAQWVFSNAEDWEERQKEPLREAVRNDIAVLMQDAELLAKRVGTTTDQIVRFLLNAALDPLEPKLQSAVWALSKDLEALRERTANQEVVGEQRRKSTRELLAMFLQTDR